MLQLKQRLRIVGMDAVGCCEKQDLVRPLRGHCEYSQRGIVYPGHI
jgi:hypothetical protein